MNTSMDILAHGVTAGPGPWALLFPVVWAVVVVTVIAVLRRTAWRGGPGRWTRRAVSGGRAGDATGPWGGRGGTAAGESPVDVLSRRFAEGQMDENEYWMRLSVLNEARGSGSRANGV